MNWISVNDRLPNFQELVLCYDTQKCYIAYRKIEDEYNEHWIICKDHCCSCNGITGAITHRMRLPELPKD